MSYNFIVDETNIPLGFFDRVENVGIKVNKQTLYNLGENNNFYPLWSGCGNHLDKSKVELINQGKMKLLLISDGEALQEMTLEEAKEYFSKYTNADDRLAAWKEDTGYTEEAMKPAKKEAPAEKAEE